MKRLLFSLILVLGGSVHGPLEAAKVEKAPETYTWVRPPIDKTVDCNGDSIGDCTVRCGEARMGTNEPVHTCCLVPDRSEVPKTGSDATECVNDEKVAGG